jgi:molybdopterin converting factor small subunit
MLVRVKLHGWLKTRLRDSSVSLEMDMPEGSDIAGLIDLLRESSSLPERRAVVAVIDRVRATHDRPLQDGDKVHFYQMVSGG